MTLLPLNRAQKETILEVGYGDARVVLNTGVARSGKSFSTVLGSFLYVKRYPTGTKVICAGRSLTGLHAIIGTEIIAISRLFPDIHVKRVRDDYFVTLAGKTYEYKFYGASRLGEEQKVYGLTAGMAILDELTRIPREFYDMVLTRLSLPGSKVVATANPVTKWHWVKQDLIDRSTETRAVIEYRKEDLYNSTFTDVSMMESELFGVERERMLEGKWADNRGMVYDDYEVCRKDERGRYLFTFRGKEYSFYKTREDVDVVGIDHGPAGITAAVGFASIRHPVEGQPAIWVAVGEYYHDKRREGIRTVEELLDDVQAAFPKARLHIIDQEAVTMRHAANARGMHWKPSDSRRYRGLLICQKALADRAVLLTEDVPSLLKEFSAYAFSDAASAKGEDKQASTVGADHAADGFRYAVVDMVPAWSIYSE